VVFPTIQFAVFFPIVLVLSWALMPRQHVWKPFMLAASYLFYSAASPVFCLLLAGITLGNQIGAKLIHRSDDARTRKRIIAVVVALDLATLGVFKYYGFFATEVNALLDSVGLGLPLPLAAIALPVGISFITFQAISYSVDVYRGVLAPASTLDVALYISFFSQLVAGPIVRAHEFLPQLESPRNPRKVAVGAAVALIILGLVKKVAVADSLAREIVDPVFGVPQAYAAPDVWLATYAYAVQIYCDFSGYTDIAIGNTPLVELKRLSPKPDVRIWAKMESANPTGSVKDRVARSLIEHAEEKGLIKPGHTILEPTSGNTGISLAMICRRKGYPLKVVMPDNVTPERIQLLEMYGAEIVFSPGNQGSNGAVALANEIARDTDTYYMPYQYGNEANPLAHYNGTAKEILEELDEIAVFVAGLGTGGTLMGNARRFKEELGDSVKIVAAEPMQGEPVQGLRSLDDGFIPPIIDLSLLDRKIFVTNEDAVVWTRRLLDEEGIFAGVSSGAIARVAVRIAGEIDEGNVVFIVCDDGWKYLSSGIYTKPLDEIENLDSTVWW
jgi:[CysO sulfur-carrier protein]-thiocarboxylate-dependent cysteine synthase